MVCWHASKCSVVVYILKGAGLHVIQYINDGPDCITCKLTVAVGSVEWWFGAGLTTS